MIDFQYVGDTSALIEMLVDLRGRQQISVDLESDSYHHYTEKIAPLQIGDGENIYIVDPFGVDMEKAAPLFADRRVEKVFHDVDYDGRMLLTYLGVKPTPIFDTMVAARILGKEKVGLADLLGEYFGLSVDKGLQKADWSRRPLGREMLEYAALDVAYLIPLRERLKEEIEARGRWDWAAEEFARLVGNLEQLPERGATFTRVKRARELSPRQLAVPQALLDWREGRGKAMDIPTLKGIGTERLLKGAAAPPRNRRELQRLDALSERQIDRFGGDVLRAVEKGRKLQDAKLPAFPARAHQKRDLSAERMLKHFKAARDRRAEDLGLDPGFLLPNAALKAIARLKPSSVSELEESGLLKGWQIEAMGDALLSCLRE